MPDYYSFNKVILVGRIACEVERYDYKIGTMLAKFKIVTDQIFLKEKKPRAYFFRVVCSGKLAMWVSKYGRVGDLICVEGKLKHRSWRDPAGGFHDTTETWAEAIIFLAHPKGPKGKKVKPVKPEETEDITSNEKKGPGWK